MYDVAMHCISKADNAMSWYLIRDGAMKMVLYGTGAEHPVQLYNITADPAETTDLSGHASYAGTIADLTTKLGKTLDFKSISLDVADYNKKMFTEWYERKPFPTENLTRGDTALMGCFVPPLNRRGDDATHQ